jgi:hypothetical protein
VQPVLKAPPALKGPVGLDCAARGYRCVDGFTCTTNTSALGALTGSGEVAAHACVLDSTRPARMCAPGWAVARLGDEGEYRCLPHLHDICGELAVIPVNGGYYCAIQIGG